MAMLLQTTRHPERSASEVVGPRRVSRTLRITVSGAALLCHPERSEGPRKWSTASANRVATFAGHVSRAWENRDLMRGPSPSSRLRMTEGVSRISDVVSCPQQSAIVNQNSAIH